MEGIVAILTVLRWIREAVEGAEESMRQSRRLGERLATLEKPLQDIAAGKADMPDDAMLKRINHVINSSRDLIQTFSTTRFMRKVYSHGEDKARFAELNDALSELVIDLHFREAAAHMERSRREAEDLADQRADFERLQGMLETAITSRRQQDRAGHRELNSKMEDILSALKHLRVAAPVEIVGFQEIDYESLEVDEVSPLGQGGFGVVYAGRLDDTPVAVKRVLQADADPRVVESTRRELKIHADLRSTFIVQLLAACTVAPHFCIVMELAPHGSLYKVLHRRPAGEPPLPLLTKANMAYDAARGLLYLHKRNIVHGDVKSHNLLVFDGNRVKLCDFGLASVKTSVCRASCGKAGGTVGWMAPETGDDDYTTGTPNTDVYSLGMVLYELLADREPFQGQAPNVITVKVASGKRPLLPEPPAVATTVAAVPFVSLMTRCWQQRPGDRPACDALVAELKTVVQGLGGVELSPRRRSSSPPQSAPTVVTTDLYNGGFGNTSAHNSNGSAAGTVVSETNKYVRVTVLYPYKPQDETELELTSGDSITVLETHGSGWWMGEAADGTRGLFPHNYVEAPAPAPAPSPVAAAPAAAPQAAAPQAAAPQADAPQTAAPAAGETQPPSAAAPTRRLSARRSEYFQERVVAMYDYTPQKKVELEMMAGDIIRVAKKYPSGWWYGERDGQRGLFPSNFVTPYTGTGGGGGGGGGGSNGNSPPGSPRAARKSSSVSSLQRLEGSGKLAHSQMPLRAASVAASHGHHGEDLSGTGRRTGCAG